MTREEFEAEAWRIAGRRFDGTDMAQLMAAADAYAAAEGGLAAERRLALVNATAKVRRRFVACACGCGTQILTHDHHSRPRRFAAGHNPKTPAQTAPAAYPAAS